MKKPNLKKINQEYILLTLILIFALFLRVYSLGTPALWVDEATSSMASKMILQKGIPVFDSGILYSRAYLFHYTQAFFMLFNQNDFWARFPSVIFGLLTIFLAYFIGKEYSKSGGILSALFMSVFYLEVFFSRQARFYQLFQLMFFLSIYLLYKSKSDNNKSNIYLYLSLIAFFITINTQIAGLVLAPFFIIHILYYSEKWRKYLAILPLIPLIQRFLVIFGLPSDSVESTINYANQYFGFASNMIYLLILFIPGVIWSFIKKKRLTTLIFLPSLIMLLGVFTVQTFALRYTYFIAFPLVLYTGLLMSFMYEKFGKLILISIFLLLIFPSNLIFPHTGVNIIKPIGYNYNDYSSPEINLKEIPPELYSELKNPDNTVITFFSSSFEWYVRKPDYVLPFSMDGRGDDQISYNKTIPETQETIIVDRYSGAPILTPEIQQSLITANKPYYLIADDFSTSKLKPYQKGNLDKLINNCSIVYDERNVLIWECII